MRYHATSVGNVPFTPEEEAEADAHEAAWLIELNKKNILNQIVTLESQITSRRQREAILGTDSGWLASIDAQIVALRNQL